MKKYLLFILILSLGYSCKLTDEPIFQENATERGNKAISELQSILENHNGYWRMEYYPHNKKKYGGHNIWVRLSKGEVTAVSEQNTTEQKSLYTFSFTEAPMLTFDTYNSVLHHFSRPSAIFKIARGGDFEFLYDHFEADTLYLKGRKTGNLIRLIKFSSDPIPYIKNVQSVIKTLRTAGLAPIVVDGSEIGLRIDALFRHLEFREGTETKSLPFIYTENGFRLEEPFVLHGQTFQDFTLNADKTALQTADGKYTSHITPSPINLYEYPNGLFSYASFWDDPTFIGPQPQKEFKEVASLVSKQVAFYTDRLDLASINFGLSTVGNDEDLSPALSLNYHYIENGREFYDPYSYELSFVGIHGKPNQLDIIWREPNDNSYKFYTTDALPKVERLKNYIGKYAPYEISPYSYEYDGYTYRYVKFISAANPEVWFTLYIP